jgi:hypothetical protein
MSKIAVTIYHNPLANSLSGSLAVGLLGPGRFSLQSSGSRWN